MAVARGVEPRPRASDARVISISPGDGWQLPRCFQDSYAPERWWLGDQPWDRTTFSRASAERYDHTSSLVGMEPTAGVEPAPAPYEGAVLPATLRRRGMVQARGLDASTRREAAPSSQDDHARRDRQPRFSGNRPDVLPLDEPGGVVPPAGVEPAWVRLKGGGISGLPRRGEAGCRAGIRTRIFPVNSRRCCRCHHPTSEDESSWRPDVDSNTIGGVRGRGPAIDDLLMVGSGGLEPPHTCTRGRWATDCPTTRRRSGAGVSGRSRTG